MGKILALDFGLKRTGIAVTDELQLIASPLTTVNSQELDAYLADYLKKHAIECIVLGHPTDQLGRSTDITQNVILLKEHLEKIYPALPVHLYDERFTSSMASAALVQSGMKKKKRQQKGNLDMTSAAIILQGYLRSRESR